VTFDERGQTNTVIAALIGGSEDYNIFSIKNIFITGNTDYYVKLTSLNDVSASVSIKGYFVTLPQTIPLIFPTLLL